MKKVFWLFSICLLLAAPRQAAAVPVISANGVVNNASFAPGSNALAPGTLAAIFGTGLNDGSQNPFSTIVNGRLVTTLGGASVTFNGISAPMFSSFPTQLNVQIPLELAGSTTASVVVTVAGQQSAPVIVNIATTSPGIFTVGNGQGAVLIANTDVLVASTGSVSGRTSRPANAGEFITIFATGLGAVNNPPATGQPASGQPTVTVPQVTIGGVQATFSFSGMAPGFVALYQVNVQVPQGVGGFVPVVMSIGGKQSNVASISVSGNNAGGGNFCSGFSLSGTATSLTGTIPGNCLSNLERGSTVTGGVPVSLTGVVNGNNQTVYSGNLTGNGTGQCATGSTGNWTANISMSITVNPTVPSIATNGGILNGSFSTPSGTVSFCGSTQIFGFIPASGIITGGVAPGGATIVNIGGPQGLPPVVVRGNAQTLNGPLSGVTVLSYLFNNFGQVTGSVSISATGATSGDQTVFTGTGAGGGNVQQCPGGPGTWTANLSSFTATVNPSVTSLATSGGTVSGNWSASLSGTACGVNQSRNMSGTIFGRVSPGGSLLLNLVISGGGGDGGGNTPLVLTGTATSLTGTLPGNQLIDSTATGSVAITATGTSAGNLTSGQTVYTASGSGSGTTNCQNITGSNTNGTWTASLTSTAIVSPPITLLATSGGTVSGSYSFTLTLTACGQNQTFSGAGTATGTVSAGGAVSLSLNDSGDDPVVLTGTAGSVSGALRGDQFLDSNATGSIPLSLTGSSSAGQTVYTGGGSGSGTTPCSNGTTGNWTATLTLTITVSPAVTSVATSGGTVTGNATHNLTGTSCGSNISDQGTDSVLGSVSPGGVITLSL